MPPRLGLALALELIGRPPSASTATVTWTHSASIAPPPSAIEFAEVSALGDDTLALAAGQGPESVAVFTYDRRAEGWSAPTRIDFPGLAEPVALALDDGILTLVGESDGSVGIATAARDGGSWASPVVVATIDRDLAFSSRLASLREDRLALLFPGIAGPNTSCIDAWPRALLYRRQGALWLADGEVRLGDLVGGSAEILGCQHAAPTVTVVAIGGDRLAIALITPSDASPPRHGRVLLYRRRGVASWHFEALLEADDRTLEEPHHVALISDETLLLGAPAAYGGRGAVDIYADRGAGWRLEQRFEGIGSGVPELGGGRFGEALALDGDLLLVGAPVEDLTLPEFSGGIVHVLAFAGEWREEATLTLPAPNNGFGARIALRGNEALIVPRWLDEPSEVNAHLFLRSGELPTGRCVDTSECTDRPCVDGLCALPEDADEGCGCRTGSPPFLAALLPLLAIGRRRGRPVA